MRSIWCSGMSAALALWACGLAILLVLFRLHATDVLNIGL